jgi:GDP-L-fucose synthase
MRNNSHIFVAGDDTLIGASLLHRLKTSGHKNAVGNVETGLDLHNTAGVEYFFKENSVEYIFLAAGKSGGIMANVKYPADLIFDNLIIECNVIHAAHKAGVKKLLYLASSCSYPKHCPQPMKEEYILTGPLEPTNEAYAVAKIAGIKLCESYRRQHGEDFICGIPANAFGPGDDFDPENSHVIAALVVKIHDAVINNTPKVEIWGTGAPRREFIFTDDLAGACIFAMLNYSGEPPINLGVGNDVSIKQLAEAVSDIAGFKGELAFDTSKPDGMPVKLLDSGKLSVLGWKPEVEFREALKKTYDWYVSWLKEKK